MELQLIADTFFICDAIDADAVVKNMVEDGPEGPIHQGEIVTLLVRVTHNERSAFEREWPANDDTPRHIKCGRFEMWAAVYCGAIFADSTFPVLVFDCLPVEGKPDGMTVGTVRVEAAPCRG